MTNEELFAVTLLLWAGVVGLFVLAGFITGEWVEKYRALRDWIRERRDHHGDSGLPTASRAG
jgi:hypothetical protein